MAQSSRRLRLSRSLAGWLYLCILVAAPTIATVSHPTVAMAEQRTPTSAIGKKVTEVGDEWLAIGFKIALYIYAFAWIVCLAHFGLGRTQQAMAILFGLAIATVILVCFDQLIDPFQWH